MKLSYLYANYSRISKPYDMIPCLTNQLGMNRYAEAEGTNSIVLKNKVE